MSTPDESPYVLSSREGGIVTLTRRINAPSDLS